jgi:hypothetical protein
MVLTDANITALIVSEVGDVDGVLAANIATMYAMNAQYRAIPQLQYLTTKMQAVETALTALRAQGVRKTVGPLTLDNTRQIDALERMLPTLAAKIAVRIKQYMGSQGSVGAIAATTPEVPPAFQPASPFGNSVDANDARYRGDAYRRSTPRTF